MFQEVQPGARRPSHPTRQSGRGRDCIISRVPSTTGLRPCSLQSGRGIPPPGSIDNRSTPRQIRAAQVGVRDACRYRRTTTHRHECKSPGARERLRPAEDTDREGEIFHQRSHTRYWGRDGPPAWWQVLARRRQRSSTSGPRRSPQESFVSNWHAHFLLRSLGFSGMKYADPLRPFTCHSFR